MWCVCVYRGKKLTRKDAFALPSGVCTDYTTKGISGIVAAAHNRSQDRPMALHAPSLSPINAYGGYPLRAWNDSDTTLGMDMSASTPTPQRQHPALRRLGSTTTMKPKSRSRPVSGTTTPRSPLRFEVDLSAAAVAAAAARAEAAQEIIEEEDLALEPVGLPPHGAARDTWGMGWKSTRYMLECSNREVCGHQHSARDFYFLFFSLSFWPWRHRHHVCGEA